MEIEIQFLYDRIKIKRRTKLLNQIVSIKQYIIAVGIRQKNWR